MGRKTKSGIDHQTAHPYLKTITQSYKKGFKSVVIFSFFINLLVLAVPIYMLQVYDKIIPNNSTDTLYFITIAVVLALITLSALELLRSSILAKLGVWFNKKLGSHLLSSSISAAAKSSDKASVNGIRDLASLRDFTTSPALISLLDLPWVPLYIGILFVIHPIIGALVSIGAIVLFVVAIFNEKTTRSMTLETEESFGQTVDVAASYVRNADVITAMGMREQLTERWEKQQHRSLALRYDVDKKRAKTSSVIKLIRFIMQIAVIGVAALLILKGEISPGATIATILLMRNAISPLERSISAWRSVRRARSAYGKINKSLYYSPALENKTGVSLRRFTQGVLTIEGLRYRYPSAKHSLFYGLSFKVNPGEAVALVGPSASGKSTLSKILIGITKPSAGTVSLNKQNLSVGDAETLGSKLGYLPQSVELFAGSVRENIARMQEGDEAQVIKAAKLVGLHTVITSFSEGYETDIGEDGTFLSGGQRQRIGLARAVYGDPWLVVLDEPDANLDAEGKASLVMTIKKLKAAGAMIIIITHQESIHQFMDKIFDLGKKRFISKQPQASASNSKNSSRSSSRKSSSSGSSSKSSSSGSSSKSSSSGGSSKSSSSGSSSKSSSSGGSNKSSSRSASSKRARA